MGTGAQEAFQLINNVCIVLYNVYFGMMFLIPLVVGSRFGKPPGMGLKIASLSGFLVTLVATILSVFPIVDVKSPLVFAEKIIGTAVAINLAGALVFWSARRKTSA
jgi:hypothetical protein